MNEKGNMKNKHTDALPIINNYSDLLELWPQKGESKVKVVFTPAGAQSVYEQFKFEHNRPISKITVERLAREMSNGAWIANGESIDVMENLRIGNGHHRLQACIKSKTSFITWVGLNMPEGSELTYDQHRPRSVPDLLTITNTHSAKDAGAVARLVIFHDMRGGLPTGDNNISIIPNREVAAYICDHPDIVDSARAGRRMRDALGIIPGRAWGAVWHLGLRVAPEQTKTFYADVESGSGLKQGHPALALRNYISKHAATKRQGMRVNQLYHLRMLCKAWDAAVNGRSVLLLKYNEAEWTGLFQFKPKAGIL